MCGLSEGGKCCGKRDGEQVEGNPTSGEYGFKHGSQLGLIEDLQLVKEGLSCTDVQAEGTASARALRQERASMFKEEKDAGC